MFEFLEGSITTSSIITPFVSALALIVTRSAMSVTVDLTPLASVTSCSIAATDVLSLLTLNV